MCFNVFVQSGNRNQAQLAALFAAEEGRAATVRELLSLGCTNLEENLAASVVEEAGDALSAPLRMSSPALNKEEDLLSLVGRAFPSGKGVLLFYMLVEEPFVGVATEGSAPSRLSRSCVVWVICEDGSTHVVKTDLALQVHALP